MKPADQTGRRRYYDIYGQTTEDRRKSRWLKGGEEGAGDTEEVFKEIQV